MGTVCGMMAGRSIEEVHALTLTVYTHIYVRVCIHIYPSVPAAALHTCLRAPTDTGAIGYAHSYKGI